MELVATEMGVGGGIDALCCGVLGNLGDELGEMSLGDMKKEMDGWMDGWGRLSSFNLQRL